MHLLFMSLIIVLFKAWKRVFFVSYLKKGEKRTIGILDLI